MLCTWAKVHLQFTGARTAGALNPSVYYLRGQPKGTDVFLHQTPHSEFSMTLVLPLSQDLGLKTWHVDKWQKREPSLGMQLY